jgi:hypothetical protein
MSLWKVRIKKKTRRQNGGFIPRCQCSSSCKKEVLKGDVFCEYHSQNGCPILSPLSGYEPDYEPEIYNNDKSIQHSHNCFAYAMDVRDPIRINKCRDKNECNTPQPGRKKGHPEFSGKMGKSCGDVLSRTMADVPKAYLTNFESKCEPGFSKIFTAVDKQNDYHYYREDKLNIKKILEYLKDPLITSRKKQFLLNIIENKDKFGMWSHKPGGRPVKNTDSNGALIYRPDLAGREYPPEYNGDSGLNYNSACGYMCVPRKGLSGVNPIQVAGRLTKKRRSYS